MKFVESCGVDIKTIRISAEDIVDGKVKVVLAMVFQIIVKYESAVYHAWFTWFNSIVLVNVRVRVRVCVCVCVWFLDT